MTPATVLRILLPFALGYYVSYFFRTVNAVIAPDLIRDVGLNAGALGVLTGAYLIAFAAAQLPLGVLLDRFGSRRSESALLLFAALGALTFSLSSSLGNLIIGRALIGLGVSACLMAAFKAFAVSFPKDKLPLVNGVVMTAGGLGSLSATAPVEFALRFTDWRGLFVILAGVTLATAVIVFVVVPERRSAEENQPPQETLAEQIRGIGRVYSDPVFLRLMPVAVTTQGTILALQGLWAGPWLRDVAGLAPADVAGGLFWIAFAQMAGFLTLGVVAERLGRVGVKSITVGLVGMGVALLAQVAIALRLGPSVLAPWVVFTYSASAGILCYAALGQHFPARIIGRVNTGLNLIVFVAAFAIQAGAGAVIDLFPRAADGGFGAEGYAAAFALLIALQAASFLWYGAAGAWWPKSRW